MGVKAFCLIVACGVITGCCLQQLEFKPEASALDIKAAKMGSVSGQITLKMKDCCPDKDQERIAREMQRKVADLYDQVINDKITIETYNSKASAARTALEKVVLLCQAVKDTEAGKREIVGFGGVSLRDQLKNAWKHSEDLLKNL